MRKKGGFPCSFVNVNIYFCRYKEVIAVKSGRVYMLPRGEYRVSY